MASSRKPRPKAESQPGDALPLALRAAVADLPADPLPPAAALAAPRRRAKPGPLIVAFSGGRDSTALLHAAVRLRDLRTAGWRDLRAVHVHHGLHADAGRWADHCRAQCEAWQVPLDVIEVDVRRAGRGLEAAARDARYAALAQVALDHKARAVLTAHHRDDRIETFLINWLRGAGLDGLAAMPAARAFADGRVLLLRPLLDVARGAIDDYLWQHRLAVLDDPSNDDTRLLRNALRTQVLPPLAAARPGYEAAAARSVELVAEGAQALRELAAQDLAACTQDTQGTQGTVAGALKLDALALLSPARQRLVLRAWLAAAGIEAPPRARLDELRQQALTARRDARLLVRAGGAGGLEVRRHRGLLLLHAAEARDQRERGGRRFHWQGEASIALPEWGGELRFEPVNDAEGFDPDWLRAAALEVRPRGGGERFKPHPTRPSKTLKRLFQDAGIAEFQRAGLPLVWRVEPRESGQHERLIFVAGLGADVRLTDRDGARIRLAWQPAADLIAGAAPL